MIIYKIIMLSAVIALLLNSKPYLYIIDKFINPLSVFYDLFTCALCFGTYVSAFFWLFNIGFGWEVIGLTAISAITSELLSKLLKK